MRGSTHTHSPSWSLCELTPVPHGSPSVTPRAAHLGRRSWVGRHRQAERLGHRVRGRVLHRHTERRCVVNAIHVRADHVVPALNRSQETAAPCSGVATLPPRLLLAKLLVALVAIGIANSPCTAPQGRAGGRMIATHEHISSPPAG